MAPTGNWVNAENIINQALLGNPIFQSRSKEPKPQRKHHYTFDVDDNGLDINGFILHHNKHEGKRHKFRVYLDSNENGRFDKNDELIGRSGPKQKHASKGVGNLLYEGEIGELVVKFKTTKSNASMREPDDIDGLSQSIGGGGGRIGSMSFSDSDGEIVFLNERFYYHLTGYQINI